jgi:hypothetical protein
MPHYHLADYDRRVGNPFAFMRKFSGKTASIGKGSAMNKALRRYPEPEAR